MFPKEGICAVDGCSGEGLPTGVDAVEKLCAITSGDGDGAAAVEICSLNSLSQLIP